MKFRMIKEGNVYYPLVERKPLFGLLGTYWDYLFPDGWSSGQMMCFYTQEDAEDCIRHNESIGNHIERCYEVRPTKRASDGLESPAKKQSSTAGSKSPAKKRKVTSRA